MCYDRFFGWCTKELEDFPLGAGFNTFWHFQNEQFQFIGLVLLQSACSSNWHNAYKILIFSRKYFRSLETAMRISVAMPNKIPSLPTSLANTYTFLQVLIILILDILPMLQACLWPLFWERCRCIHVNLPNGS